MELLKGVKGHLMAGLRVPRRGLEKRKELKRGHLMGYLMELKMVTEEREPIRL